MSKTTLNALTLQLAEALRSRNIAVNAMCPGWTQTRMGGHGAPRTVAQGAAAAVWLATEVPSSCATYRVARLAMMNVSVAPPK